ncbi:proprotein convertase P-domain-containing protein [Streptomyces sp. C10-9-1]|uniref:proprotein convertase P-domain-containing protein n=1 Tax=Streptomyces sp. C10-9-1 TaxID=1859285 RepID=UPI002112C637|nr:proprotein convertase P-domain-containing protein [Streptomyces sp. C10-9-1]MCQ6555010.1 proprotein convertase P-domain-containing protein [Streptomyces sp. C10-9-1]
MLAYLLTATLLAASIVLATATASHASPGNHRPATWNMQGASSSSDSKWTTTVSRLLTGGHNYRSHDVVALQEAGPRSSLPGAVLRAGTITNVNGRQATYDYEVRRWRVGSASRGRDVFITWLNTDPTGNRNNVAIVTYEDPGTPPTVVAARQANNTSWGMRPALGVRLSDGSWFYSFHASSNGDNRSNDAQNMLFEVSSRGGQWAVLGDFNRNPVNLFTIPAGSQIYRSYQGTQQGGGELDYMVSNDRSNMIGWNGRRLNGASSDHYPVEFLWQAHGGPEGENRVHLEDDPRRCLAYAPQISDHIAQVRPCDDVNATNFGMHPTLGFYLETPDHVRCIEAASQPVPFQVQIFVDIDDPDPNFGHCSGDISEKWVHKEDTNLLYNLAWDACMKHLDGEAWGQVCQPDRSEQRWIRTGDLPYVWDFVPVPGPSTGTEDAQTSGSGGSGSGSCPMPSGSLDPCHHISKRSTTDVNIVDNSTVHSPIAVNDIGGSAPSNLQVGVDIKHTYRGDLDLHVVAPDGSSYHLEDIPNGDSGDDVFKSYTVNASSESSNGTWQLRVRDTYTGDEGYIDAWNLTFPNEGSSGGSSGGSSSDYTAGDFENTDNKTISDYTTVESPIAASGLGSGSAPSNLKVSVDIKHSYIGDLKIWLVGPQGGQWLLEDPLGSGVNLLKTYTVNASSQSAEGLWRLKVEDNAGGDVGYIDRWSLTFD